MGSFGRKALLRGELDLLVRLLMSPVSFVFVSVREGGSERGGELLRAWRKDANGCLGAQGVQDIRLTFLFFFVSYHPWAQIQEE
jgi:hypothetical protein